MSSIYTIQREQHMVNINQITKDEINKRTEEKLFLFIILYLLFLFVLLKLY